MNERALFLNVMCVCLNNIHTTRINKNFYVGWNYSIWQHYGLTVHLRKVYWSIDVIHAL